MTEYDDYGIPVGAYQEPEGLGHQAWRVARAFYLYRIRPLVGSSVNTVQRGNWSYKRLLTLANALVVLWWAVLYWGESGAFNGNIESCSWDKWENWASQKLSMSTIPDGMLIWSRKLAQTPTDSSSSQTRSS